MLSPTFSKVLFVCPLSPPWNLPSFSVEPTLFSPCSRSDPLLSRQDVALVLLDPLPPHDLVIWTGGFVPFPCAKGSSGVLSYCSLCDTEETLYFQQARYALVIPLKPAPFCKSPLVSAVSAIFLFFSSFQTLAMSWQLCPTLVFPFTPIALARTVFSFLMCYRGAMGSRALVSCE